MRAGWKAEYGDDRFVYFVQAETGGPIKIGVAGNPAAALNRIQHGNPAELRIIGVIPGAGGAVETELHRRFAHAWIRSEWFEPIPDLVSHIEAVAEPYALPPRKRPVRRPDGALATSTP